MKKRVTGIFFAGIIAVSMAITPVYGSSTNKKLTEAEKVNKEQKNQLNQVQDRLQSLEEKKGDLESYIKELEKQFKELEANLHEIQAQEKCTQEELKKLEVDLLAAEKEEEDQYSRMKLRIQYMYENSNQSYLNLFLEANSFTEFLSQAENMSQLVRFDRKMLEDYKKITREIKEKEIEIKKQQEELKSLKEESLDKQDEISTIMKTTHAQIATYEDKIQENKNNVQSLMNKIEKQQNKINALIKEEKDKEAEEALKPNKKPNPAPITPSPQPTPQQNPSVEEKPVEKPSQNTEKGKYLGNFRLTAYCACAKCCGVSTGITASGTVATQGRTVAMYGVPFGTKLLINGTVYTVEDRGTAYGHVDIFFNSHQAALQFGSQRADVYQVN